MTDPAAPDPELRSQAHAWLVRRHSGEWDRAQLGALEAWLATSEAHRQAYAEAEAFWSGLQGFRSRAFPALEAAERYRVRGTPFRPRLAAVLAAALALVAIFIAAFWDTSAPRIEGFHTAKGEKRSVRLPDGSTAELNTDTDLTVKHGARATSVYLDHGEAFFRVAHHEARAFEVFAAATHIRDLGTEFNVYHESGRVSVAVLGGTVRISAGMAGSPRLLHTGERIDYRAAGGFTAIERIDRGALAPWREGKLVFREQPLAALLSEIARYHAVAFEVPDPKLAALPVSGTFKTDDLGVLLATIEATLPVTAERTATGLVRLTPRRRRSTPAVGRPPVP